MASSDPQPGVPTPTGTLQGAAMFYWDGSAWLPSPAPAAAPTLGAGLSPSGTLQADHQATQTVSTGTATITPASGTSSILVTLTASTTLTIANGSYNGQHLRLELLQDGSGSHTVAFDSSVIFGTDVTSFTATTAASKRDLVQLIWNGTKWMFAASNKGF
jgi:hypothetical protein